MDFDDLFERTEQFNEAILSVVMPKLKTKAFPYPLFNIKALEKTKPFLPLIEAYARFIEQSYPMFSAYFLRHLDDHGKTPFIHPMVKDILQSDRPKRNIKTVMLAATGNPFPIATRHDTYVDKVVSISVLLKMGVVPGLIRKVIPMKKSEIYKIYRESNIELHLRRGSLPSGVYWAMRKKQKVIAVNAFLSVFNAVLPHAAHFGQAFAFADGMIRRIGVTKEDITPNQMAEIIGKGEVPNAEIRSVSCACKRVCVLANREHLAWHGICVFCGL
jgi:hypothetical protein